MQANLTLTTISGLLVGHWHDTAAATGCTVILCPPEGCIASGEARGSAPGTREIALLEPEKRVEHVNAVVLSGGSAYGLASAHGVMRYLERKGHGFSTPYGVVPIVPAAVIYDLSVGKADVRPGEAEGLAAAESASRLPVPLGRVGAGVGSSCGKYLGAAYAQYGGLGSAVRAVGGATVAALSVANPFGDIVDPDTGKTVAGACYEDGSRPQRDTLRDFFRPELSGSNTTLVVVATDAPITKAEAKLLASSAHVGIARVMRPSHTIFDGDTTFALSTGTGPQVPLLNLSVAVQEVVAESLLIGARLANARGEAPT